MSETIPPKPSHQPRVDFLNVTMPTEVTASVAAPTEETVCRTVPPSWLAALLLVLLVGLVFYPILQFQFINLDVGVQILTIPTFAA